MSKRAAGFVTIPIFALAAWASVARAATSWVSQGPFGGFADSVAVDPVTHDVYAGNFGGGVLKSADMGLHWAPANTGLGNILATTVESVAASPSASGRLIIGTQNGIWLTTNGGASWSPTNVVGNPGDSEFPEIAGVAFAHSDPTRAYGAEDGSHGVWRSVDSGAHWTSSLVGITDTSLISVAVDPTSADTVYAGTFGGRLFRSSDGGKTWHESDGGIPDTGIFSLLVDPSQPATVVAGTRDGLFRSTDHAATWHPAAGGPPANPDQDQTPYGLFASTFGNIPTLYAAFDLGGLFASTDHGASWHRQDQNLAPLGPQAFVLDTSANVAYAGLGEGSGGAARSTDGGHTWSLANNGYTAQYVPVVAFDPRSPNIVLAGAWGFGVFRSTDAGTTWTAIPPVGFVERLFFDRHDPAVAYFVAGNEVGVYKSTNRGQSWTAINHGLGSLQQFQALAQSGSGSVLLTGDYLGDLFRSTDGGANWHPVTGFTATSIVSLAADPGAASTFFLATDASIFKSTDGGLHWTHSATGYPSGTPGEILVDPFDSHVVLAGSVLAFDVHGTGGWRSTNGGATWNAVGGPLASEHVRTYAADPAHPGVLYAGTFGGGVFRSTDHGATWAPFTAAGLENLNVVALAVSSSGGSLQAGTDATSTFRFDFPGRYAVAVPGATTVPKIRPRP